jgi:membrane protein
MFRHVFKVPSLLKATLAEWRKDNPSLFAAALAFYSFFSIIPILVIVAAIGNLFFGQAAVAGQLETSFSKLFGDKVANVIQTTLASTYNQTSNVVVAVAAGFVILGASYVFVQMRNALNMIWNVKENKKTLQRFVEGRLVSLVMVIGVSALLLMWLATSTTISAFILLSASGTVNSLLIETVNFILLFIISSLLFAMIYKLLPSIKLKWKDVGLGAMVTAFLFTTGSYLIAFYISKVSIASLYGVAGSIVVLLFWLYISAQLFLFGVVFTKVYASRHGSHRKRSK